MGPCLCEIDRESADILSWILEEFPDVFPPEIDFRAYKGNPVRLREKLVFRRSQQHKIGHLPDKGDGRRAPFPIDKLIHGGTIQIAELRHGIYIHIFLVYIVG